MNAVTRRIEFCAGHRVLGHSGRCRYLHGHNLTADVTIGSTSLNALGMVIDFSEIKDKAKGWIDNYWDHNLILHKDDPLAKLWLTGTLTEREAIFAGRLPYIMDGNPTVENLAKELASVCLVKFNFQIVKVRLYESENGWAEYTPEEEYCP